MKYHDIPKILKYCPTLSGDRPAIRGEGKIVCTLEKLDRKN